MTCVLLIDDLNVLAHEPFADFISVSHGLELGFANLVYLLLSSYFFVQLSVFFCFLLFGIRKS